MWDRSAQPSRGWADKSSMVGSTSKSPRVLILLRQLAQSGLDANAADSAARHDRDPTVHQRGDQDLDGVPDDTEAWLGTSSLTDQTVHHGRDDAGSVVDAGQLPGHDRMCRSKARFTPVGRVNPALDVPAPPS